MNSKVFIIVIGVEMKFLNIHPCHAIYKNIWVQGRTGSLKIALRQHLYVRAPGSFSVGLSFSLLVF